MPFMFWASLKAASPALTHAYQAPALLKQTQHSVQAADPVGTQQRGVVVVKMQAHMCGSQRGFLLRLRTSAVLYLLNRMVQTEQQSHNKLAGRRGFYSLIIRAHESGKGLKSQFSREWEGCPEYTLGLIHFLWANFHNCLFPCLAGQDGNAEATFFFPTQAILPISLEFLMGHSDAKAQVSDKNYPFLPFNAANKLVHIASLLVPAATNTIPAQRIISPPPWVQSGPSHPSSKPPPP